MLPLFDDVPTERWPFVTLLLIVINTLVMGWLALLSPLDADGVSICHGFVPARVAQLGDAKLVVEVPVFSYSVQRGQLLPKLEMDVLLPAVPRQVFGTMFSYMFLHGDWWHLLGNMVALWVFGKSVENRLGAVLYVVFYVLGGLAAAATHWAYDPESVMPVVGASGAIAALMGGYAVSFPKARIRTAILYFWGLFTLVYIRAYIWMAIWMGLQFLSALAQYIMEQTDGSQLGVAVWAHIGGFFAGVLLMPLFLLVTAEPEEHLDWHELVDGKQSTPLPH